ncbi:MAG: tRNA (adenosine(37)-N6)-threonylcarbamoyltransferase complex transferase subunit TsaD [Thermodesulfobacteriota bacterium]
MLVLGIETSCDETAAAVLTEDGRVLASVVDSQVAIHSRFGGVVPELASRRHMEAVAPVVFAALDGAGVGLEAIDFVAATQGPGLVGSLLVGFSFAKALAYVRRLPLVGVNHMAGHVASVFLTEDPPAFPFVCLVASGGHSSLFLVEAPARLRLLGQTRDDAAGEAFDKVAKILGLGYPGGPLVSAAAQGADPAAIRFPRALLEEDSLDFSFSGIKTAVAQHVWQEARAGRPVSPGEVCAGFQEAVVEVLVAKLLRAAAQCRCPRLALAGGVAANERLRALLAARATASGLAVWLPAPAWCTDNAAMIALAGLAKYDPGLPSALDADVYSRSSFPGGLLAV